MRTYTLVLTEDQRYDMLAALDVILDSWPILNVPSGTRANLRSTLRVIAEALPNPEPPPGESWLP